MTSRLSLLATFLFGLGSLVACSSDSDPDEGGSSGTSSEALSCESLALCDTYSVKNFLDTVPDPAGGTVRDGVYRLAYTVESHDEQDFAGYRGGSVEALLVQEGRFVRAGGLDRVGTFATSGSKITFTDQARCNLGATGDASTSTDTVDYTATADRLDFFVDGSIGTKAYRHQDVYLRASTPDDVCTLVDTEPQAPGDSPMCTVTNCGCTVKSNSGAIASGSCN